MVLLQGFVLSFICLLSKAGAGSVGTMPQLIGNVCQESRLAEGGMSVVLWHSLSNEYLKKESPEDFKGLHSQQERDSMGVGRRGGTWGGRA